LRVAGVTNNPAAEAIIGMLGTNPFGALGGTCTQVTAAGAHLHVLSVHTDMLLMVELL
jgi:hypothetical protein